MALVWQRRAIRCVWASNVCNVHATQIRRIWTQIENQTPNMITHTDTLQSAHIHWRQISNKTLIVTKMWNFWLMRILFVCHFGDCNPISFGHCCRTTHFPSSSSSIKLAKSCVQQKFIGLDRFITAKTDKLILRYAARIKFGKNGIQENNDNLCQFNEMAREA